MMVEAEVSHARPLALAFSGAESHAEREKSQKSEVKVKRKVKPCQ